MAKFAKTQTEAAPALGISRATFIACSKEPGFPKETKQGWPLEAIDQWLQANGRGPYRRGSGGETTSDEDGVTLTEAKIKLTIEQSENERIKKERQLVEQAKEIEQILDRDDVERAFSQQIATTCEQVDALHTAADRTIPDEVECKEAVLAMIAKLRSDIHSAISELWLPSLT